METTTTDTDRDHTASHHIDTNTDCVRRRVDVDPLSPHRVPVGNVQCDDTAALKADIAFHRRYVTLCRGLSGNQQEADCTAIPQTALCIARSVGGQ